MCDPYVNRVFPVNSLKNAKDKDKKKHQRQVPAVFGRDEICIVFCEITSTPSTMEATRVLTFMVLCMKLVIPQANCIKDYLKAYMERVLKISRTCFA